MKVNLFIYCIFVIKYTYCSPTYVYVHVQYSSTVRVQYSDKINVQYDTFVLDKIIFFDITRTVRVHVHVRVLYNLLLSMPYCTRINVYVHNVVQEG